MFETHLDVRPIWFQQVSNDKIRCCQILKLLLKFSIKKMLSMFPGLQDNMWYCDCRISKLLEMSKTSEGQVMLIDPLVTCSGPENLAGVLFKQAELDQCIKPAVMTSATKITSSLGSNVLLRCDATGYPTPTLSWCREDGSVLSNTGNSSNRCYNI